MADGLGGDLKKTLTKPPMPTGKGKPQVTIVRISKSLASFKDGMFTVDIDSRYAEVTSRYREGDDLQKPDWLVAPGQEDLIIWFSQNPFNTIIIHKDVKYLLMQVKKGQRREIPCTNEWCKRDGASCGGHRGASEGFITEYDRRWILKPVTLPQASEDWINKHLAEVL